MAMAAWSNVVWNIKENENMRKRNQSAEISMKILIEMKENSYEMKISKANERL